MCPVRLCQIIIGMCHQRYESEKFFNRLISTFYKALVLAIALGFLCLLPSLQAHEFLWTLFSNTKDLGGFNFISTIEIEKEYDDDNEKTKHKS